MQVSGLPRTDGATELVSPPPAADSADKTPRVRVQEPTDPLFSIVSACQGTQSTHRASRRWISKIATPDIARRIAVRLDVHWPRRQIGVHGPPGADCGPPRPGMRPPSPAPGAGGRPYVARTRLRPCGGGETARCLGSRYVPPPSCTCCQLTLLQTTLCHV